MSTPPKFPQLTQKVRSSQSRQHSSRRPGGTDQKNRTHQANCRHMRGAHGDLYSNPVRRPASALTLFTSSPSTPPR
jgi:hypothetical protein